MRGALLGSHAVRQQPFIDECLFRVGQIDCSANHPVSFVMGCLH
jgi:hypothetical protein